MLSLDWTGKFTSPAPLYFELSIGRQKGSGHVLMWVELSTTEASYSLSSLRVEMDYFVSITAVTSSGLHTTATQLIAGIPLGV